MKKNVGPLGSNGGTSGIDWNCGLQHHSLLFGLGWSHVITGQTLTMYLLVAHYREREIVSGTGMLALEQVLAFGNLDGSSEWRQLQSKKQ